MTITDIPRRAILGPEELSMLAMRMNQHILVTDAAKETGLNPDILSFLVSQGVIPGNYNGNNSTCDLNEAKAVAKKLSESRNGLENVGIMATVAAEKYNFSSNAIYRWAREGWISIISYGTGKRSKLYNEADISFARAMANLIGYSKGKAIFPAQPRSGRPKKS